MLGDKGFYLKYNMLPIFEHLNQNMNTNLKLSRPPKATSGSGEKIFSGRSAKSLHSKSLKQKE